MNSFIKKNWQNITILYLLVGSLIYWVVGIYLIRYLGRGGDGFLRWQESSYVLRHINPLHIVNKSIEPLDEIGNMMFYAGAFPWTYIINNVLLTGFLDWYEAEVLALFLIIFLLTTLVYAIYKRFLPEIGKKNAIICVLLATTSYAWLSGIKQFQHGVFVGIFLLLFAIIDHKKHPILTGIVITLAMIKPQSAILFYMVLLAEKEYRSIITSFLLGMLATIIAGVLLMENPFKLIIEYLTFTSPIGEPVPNTYYGIFDFLKLYGVTYHWVMLFCAVIGIVLLIGLFWKYRKLPGWILCVIPAAISPIWTYHHAFDLQYLAIISIVGFVSILRNKQSRWKKYVIIIAIIVATLPLPNSLYEKFWVLPLLQRVSQFMSAYLILSVATNNNYDMEISK